MKAGVLAALAAFVVQCGSEEDGGGGSGNPNPPETKVVPSDFTNTATTASALGTAISDVSSEIVGEARTELGLSGSIGARRNARGDSSAAVLGTLRFMGFKNLVRAATDEEEEEEETESLENFGKGLEVGGDCDDFFNSLAKNSDDVNSFFSSLSDPQEYVDENFELKTEEIPDYYTVTKVTTTKYAYHLKATKKTTSSGSENIFGSFLPNFEMAAGAGENTVAAMFASDLTFEMSGEENGQTKKVKMVMNGAQEMYADTETSTVVLGGKTKVILEGGEDGTTNMSVAFNLSLTGGESPAFAGNMDMSGTANGKPMNGFVSYDLTKAAENSYVVEFSGKVDGKEVGNKVTVNKTSTGCAVEAIE